MHDERAVRRFHRGDLDPVRDRLAYRTAPLGLLKRETVERLGLRFPEGLPTGEDQAFSARLWFEGRGLRYAAGAPRYVVGADAVTRVSTTPRPLRRTAWNCPASERMGPRPGSCGLG